MSSDMVINVDRKKLVETLKTNRQTHIDDHKEALEGWVRSRRSIIAQATHVIDTDDEEQFLKALANLSNRLVETQHRPVEHTENYDLAIGMLELSVDDTVELTAQQYRELVKDDWTWKSSFMATKNFYSASS